MKVHRIGAPVRTLSGKLIYTNIYKKDSKFVVKYKGKWYDVHTVTFPRAGKSGTGWFIKGGEA